MKTTTITRRLRLGLLATAMGAALLLQPAAPAAAADAPSCSLGGVVYSAANPKPGFKMITVPTTTVTADGVLRSIYEGTPGNDFIIGTPGPDEMHGGGGDDILCGKGGDDLLEGNEGVDTIKAGLGNDNVFGGTFLVDGVDGGNLLKGGAGNDYIEGDGGPDVINGGLGDDKLFGLAGSDTINGGPGNDQLSGGPNGLPVFTPQIVKPGDAVNKGGDVCDGGEGIDTQSTCESVTNVP